ncbi:MAG TPA: peroxidase [Methylomirabilota bacterium]|jgi:Dyp-type peroxidase family|nr:peroxidase [Methylomirabilota bacterium]
MLRRADLEQPGIDPRRPKFQPLLNALQGNILKPHARTYAVYLFFAIRPGAAAKARRWIGDFAIRRMISARDQLDEAVAHRRHNTQGRPVINLFLSASGYRALGRGLAMPADRRFRDGMKRSRRSLKDPPPATWDRGYRGPVHAALLIADSDATRLRRDTADIRRRLGAFARVLAVERGRMWRNRQRQPIEHFGYMDGRSQPLFLTPDIRDERRKRDGINRFNPAGPLKLVLAPDPNVTPDAFGTYAVFRKLEQNVRGFKRLEQGLADTLGLSGERQRERAGALVVGRFEDGTPVALRDRDGMHRPIPNNFTYSGDAAGGRCPFHAHIRAVNARRDTTRAHRVARRGIPYGRPRPPEEDDDPNDLPTRGVGLLFLCFQRDIGAQFERLQKRSNAPRRGLVDPIIGQGRPTAVARWPRQWGGAPSDRFDFRLATRTGLKKGVVTLKGGEYFFAPSLPFLRSL